MEHSSESSAKDLLQSIIEGSAIMNSDLGSAETFIVDNCKNLYFAGHETTSVTATWCLMLLASHPQWQDCVRDEVLEVCQGKKINFDMIRKLKVVCETPSNSLKTLNRIEISCSKFDNLMSFSYFMSANHWRVVSCFCSKIQIYSWQIESEVKVNSEVMVI